MEYYYKVVRKVDNKLLSWQTTGLSEVEYKVDEWTYPKTFLIPEKNGKTFKICSPLYVFQTIEDAKNAIVDLKAKGTSCRIYACYIIPKKKITYLRRVFEKVIAGIKTLDYITTYSRVAPDGTVFASRVKLVKEMPIAETEK